MCNSPQHSWLLVRLKPEASVGGTFHAIALHPGVECVFNADLALVAPERREVLEGKPVAQPKGRKRDARHS